MEQSGGMDRLLDRAVNIVVLAVIAFALFRPGGILGAKVSEWRETAERERVVRASLAAERATMSGEPSIIEFMDYQCPFCREAEDSIARAKTIEPFQVVYRHLPLTTIHPRAEEAARVAICAEELGVLADVHEALTRTREWEEAPRVEEATAVAAAITDMERFRECLESEATDLRLAADAALAASLGVRGTPAFASPSGLESGLPSVQDLLGLLATPDEVEAR